MLLRKKTKNPEELALLRAIDANPKGDLPRLVYADWLDEHDDPTTAEFIRLQCEIATISAKGNAALTLAQMNEWLEQYIPKLEKSGDITNIALIRSMLDSDASLEERREVALSILRPREMELLKHHRADPNWWTDPGFPPMYERGFQVDKPDVEYAPLRYFPLEHEEATVPADAPPCAGPAYFIGSDDGVDYRGVPAPTFAQIATMPGYEGVQSVACDVPEFFELSRNPNVQLRSVNINDDHDQNTNQQLREAFSGSGIQALEVFEAPELDLSSGNLGLLTDPKNTCRLRRFGFSSRSQKTDYKKLFNSPVLSELEQLHLTQGFRLELDPFPELDTLLDALGKSTITLRQLSVDQEVIDEDIKKLSTGRAFKTLEELHVNDRIAHDEYFLLSDAIKKGAWPDIKKVTVPEESGEQKMINEAIAEWQKTKAKREGEAKNRPAAPGSDEPLTPEPPDAVLPDPVKEATPSKPAKKRGGGKKGAG